MNQKKEKKNQALNEVTKFSDISNISIEYLEENKTKIFGKGINKIFEDEVFQSKLSKINKLTGNSFISDFKKSILDEKFGHFEWIKKDIFRPQQVDFPPYNKLTVKSLNNIYCEFYKAISIDIMQIETESIKLQLKEYFDGFADASC